MQLRSFGRFVAFAGSLALCAVAGGCAAPDRGYVQKEWSDTFRELGIVPLFPPREDVVVGDVYAYDFDPESDEVRRIMDKKFESLNAEERKIRTAVGMSPRTWRADLGDEIFDEYEDTPAFPATNSADLTLLAGIDVAEGLKAVQARLDGSTQRLAQAQAGFNAAKVALGAIDVEIQDLEKAIVDGRKVPDKEDEAAKKKRLEKLAADQDTLSKKTAERIKLLAAFDVASKVLELRKEELVLSRKALEVAQERAANPPKRFNQPTSKKYDVFRGERFERGEPKDRVNRLRLVGFPDFSSTTFTEGNLSALVPIEALMVGVNANFSNIKRVTVRVPAAESYGLSIGKLVESEAIVRPADCEWATNAAGRIMAMADRVVRSSACRTAGCRFAAGTMDRLQSAAEHDQLITVPRRDDCACCHQLVNDLNRLLVLARDVRSACVDEKPTKLTIIDEGAWAGIAATYPVSTVDEACEEIYVRVPTEVFYARALDVSVFAATSGGGRVTVNQLAAEGQTQATASAGGGGDLDLSSSGGGDLLSRSRAQLNQVQPAPGGAVQIVSMSEHAVGLRRTYDRPVAIGFRGITVRVNRLTGVVTGGQTASGAASTLGLLEKASK